MGEGLRGVAVLKGDSVGLDGRPPRVGVVAVFLAALLVGTIPLPPIMQLTIAGGNLRITWTMILVALGLINWLITHLVYGPSPRSGIYRAATAVLLLMAPPAVYSMAGATALLAYVNFAVGVCAGLLVGRAWVSRRLDQTNVIDFAFYVFVLATVGQLLVALRDAPSFEHFHQFATVGWGGSNYIAGVLVVVSVLLVARSRLLRRGRFFLLLVAFVSVVAALLTLSRGGVLAAAVGVAAMLWVLPRVGAARFFGRMLALGLPLVAWVGVDFVASQRSAVNGQADRNIDARFSLFETAWRSFLESPLQGSGWAGFRDATAALSATQTFAHNLFLSFLQIGGLLFGVTTLIILATIAVKATRKWPTIIPVVLAIVAISMTDPFMEGTIGGLVAWATLTFAYHYRDRVLATSPSPVDKPAAKSNRPRAIAR